MILWEVLEELVTIMFHIMGQVAGRAVFKTSRNEKRFALQQGLANFLFVCLFKGKMVHS